MPSVHLKRAEQKVAAMRESQESPPEIAETIDEILAAIRVIEARLAVVERRVPAHPPKWPADAL
jgi:hypothetical protein